MTGALDFSHLLDAPAGKHGFVRADGENLVFENGRRMRFFGYNLPAGGMMPEHESAEKYARRLASMGVNVVRLHAGDGYRAGRPSLIDYSKGSSLELDAQHLERTHYFIHQLKLRGIYVQVDLFCYRVFQAGDGLEHAGTPGYPAKSITFHNRRLIELQKDYAKKYLKAVNPYTGLDLTQEPAVMCVQITNENSIFWGTPRDIAMPEGRLPYALELKAQFNRWLLKQYGGRDKLAAAWTREGECALQNDEDPAQGSVKTWPLGDYCQPWVDHRAYYAGGRSPARYADYIRFGTELMRGFYGEMKEYLHSLGVKVPINCNNLTNGIADIYAGDLADLTQDNAYFNHPMGSPGGTFFHSRESVLMDPRTTTYPDYNIRDNHLLMQLAGSCVSGKPFAVSEWNEYAGMPFHSTSLLAQAAYACLQDWDGLMLYAYTHEADHQNARADMMAHVYDAFNDPSLTCQIGVLASIFLGGLVSPARNLLDVCYTSEDIKMLPENFKLPFGFAPFISRTRAVFLDKTADTYTGSADAALSSGFCSSGDFHAAKHALIYARSPYADALQQNLAGKAFLDAYRSKDSKPLLRLATLDEHSVVIDDVNALERLADHTAFSRILDAAMKHWGLLESGQGLAGPRTFVSDTGEITFDFGSGRFIVRTSKTSVFSGYPRGLPVNMGSGFTAYIKNEKMSLSLLSLDSTPLEKSKKLLVTGIGETGNDGNRRAGDVLLEYGGKLFIDRLEGSLEIAGAKAARAWALDVYGSRMQALTVKASPEGITVCFDAEKGAAAYELELDHYQEPAGQL